jgi:hypothetical protein
MPIDLTAEQKRYESSLARKDAKAAICIDSPGGGFPDWSAALERDL